MPWANSAPTAGCCTISARSTPSPSAFSGRRGGAGALAGAGGGALGWAGGERAGGAGVRETTLQRRVREASARGGLSPGDGPIAAFGPTSALPHYEPHAGADRELQAGEVLLLDLWAGPGPGSVFADQTWIAFAGRAPNADVQRVWQAGHGARDAAVATLRQRGRRATVLTGAEVDDAARAGIREAGVADYVVHRTGHSIDRDLHR